MNIAQKLDIEAEAAKTLLSNIRDVIGDDEEAVVDAVEGETGLLETIGSAVDMITELEMFVESIKLREKALKDRRERFAKQAELIRTSILMAMGKADIKKLTFDNATVSRRPVPPSLTVFDESAIPSEYWQRQDPKLDRKALLSALKGGDVIAGAAMSNGSETLSIRSA